VTVDLTEALGGFEVVALEGCDGTGKTTLADALATRYGHTVVHSGRTPDGEDLVGRYREILATPGKIVLDRCFMSELVYGPLYHGRSRISLSAASSLARIVAARGGVIVHLTGNSGILADRLRARDGSDPAVGQIVAMTDAYHAAFAMLQGAAPVITVDTTIPLPGDAP
jgi:thymidylate kinase